MEAYSWTLALMIEMKMNDRVKVTVICIPLARSRCQKTDKSWCKQD